MYSKLHDDLQELEVLDPVSSGRLQVFGLRGRNDSRLSYNTLDESITGGRLEVMEVSEGGSVPFLKVKNQGDEPVFLMAGEELVGAKQNRVLNTSIMVGAKSEVAIPVSCVEARRWHYTSQAFGSGFTSHAALRSQMAKQVSRSYRMTGSAASDQSAVWQEVARKLHALRSSSPSSALHKVFEDHRAKLDLVRNEIKAPEGSRGAVFAVGGRVVGVDLFDNPLTLEKLWPKLVRAYALDALEVEDSAEPFIPISREQVASWLDASALAQEETYGSPGLGSNVRLESPERVGSSLIVDGQPVHTELFAQAGSKAPASSLDAEILESIRMAGRDVDVTSVDPREAVAQALARLRAAGVGQADSAGPIQSISREQLASRLEASAPAQKKT